MNANFSKLQPYPFEKLRHLLASTPVADLSEISWSIGEPKHAPPEFLQPILTAHIADYSRYPATAGLPELKSTIADWINRRFLSQSKRTADNSHVLPVTGTREALFSIVHALFDTAKSNDEIWIPNPFYQIYEGAASLAGASVRYLNCLAENNYQPDFSAIADDEWNKCQMLFVCTPGNPSGRTLSLETLNFLKAKSLEHDFLLISDECYSELYRDEQAPPTGALQATHELEERPFQNTLVFHSLSKRSNLPGLRSGFVAGDSKLIQVYLHYRTYHGCAMPLPHQFVSIAAWQDEAHVRRNRQLYNEKFHAVANELENYLDVEIPEASFYLWLNLKQDDEKTAQRWLEFANVRVLPGQYLSRTVEGINPGYGHVRIALVATIDECLTATERLKKLL